MDKNKQYKVKTSVLQGLFGALVVGVPFGLLLGVILAAIGIAIWEPLKWPLSIIGFLCGVYWFYYLCTDETFKKTLEDE